MGFVVLPAQIWDPVKCKFFPILILTLKHVLAQLWEAAEVLLTGLVQSRCNNIHTRVAVCSDNQEQEKTSCGFCEPSQAACGV